MKVSVFSSKQYDVDFFTAVNKDQCYGYDLEFHKQRLEPATAELAQGSQAVCAFVNDDLSRPVLEKLAAGGTKYILLRCAGFDRVDQEACKELGMKVARVPAYSPESVAEHAAALLLTVNRKTHTAYNRVRQSNFSIENLTGKTLYGRTAGVIGTGKIGLAMVRILKGFGMKVLAYDPYPSDAAVAAGAEYVDLDTVYRESDVVSLHCPLSQENKHLLNDEAFAKMKDGVIVVNSSRGGLLDTAAAIRACQSGKIAGLALDVYENEGALFFNDLSTVALKDDLFYTLVSLPQVLITGHQAFLTDVALTSISNTTLSNLKSLVETGSTPNAVIA